MSTIGWIKIGLAVDTSAFVAGMKKSVKTVESFASKASGPLVSAARASLASLDFVYGPAVRKIGKGLASVGKAAAKFGAMAAPLVKPVAAVLALTGLEAGRLALGLGKAGLFAGKLGAKMALLGAGAAGKGLKFAAESFAHVGSGLVSGAVKLGTAGVAAGAALFAIAKHAMDASDATHGMARQLGVSNEELGKLHHVAKVAGVDAGEMDHSLSQLNQTLGKIAQEGTGPAANALRRLGIDARALANKGPTEAFRTSIDVLQRIPNAAERAAVAVELFGKSGGAMIRIAGEGAGAVDRLGEEAKALGVAISDVDSEKIGEANNALGRVWDVVQGLTNSIVVQLSPYLTYVADLFVDWATEGGRAGSIVSQGFDFVAKAIGYAADAVQVLSTGFHYMQATLAHVVSEMLGYLDKLIKKTDEWYQYFTKGKLGHIGSGAIKELADAFNVASHGELGKAEMTWNRRWAHEGVREFVDGIKVAAQARASLAAGKEAEFRQGGPFQAAKPTELKFGGGLELGSKEAYSAILQSKGMQSNSVQNKIETNTKTSAEATTRSATALEQMRDFMRQNKGDQSMAVPVGL